MAWTSKIAISQQKDNTVEILWVQLSDGGELTAEILVNVSDFIKVDGTAATGCKIEEYEMQMFGAQDVGYASLEIGSQLVDACGVGQMVSGPNWKSSDRADWLGAAGDLTVTTLATDANDVLRIKARVSLT